MICAAHGPPCPDRCLRRRRGRFHRRLRLEEHRAREGRSRLPAAKIFVERCGACHTFGVAGTQGSTFDVTDRESVDGPNFDDRKETVEDVLFAIQNGGFSGAIMPENIVTGKEAEAVARFLAKYAGEGGAGQ